MTRLIAIFLISMFALSGFAIPAFAQGATYQTLTQRMEMFSKYATENTSPDGSLPSSIAWSTENSEANLWDVSHLISARPQSFAPEDFQPLIKLGEKANGLTRLYVNGPSNDESHDGTIANQTKYQDDIAQSSVFSVHALANVAQGLSAFFGQLPQEEQEKPSRLRGKVVVNASIFQQFAAISAMIVGDHISESNRVSMVVSLEQNLPVFSSMLTKDTLSDIARNLRIRLLQLIDGSEIKTKLTTLRNSVVAMRDDKKRMEILTN